MSEPATDRDQSRQAAMVRGVRWDAIAAIIAALIGLLALCVSGYTAYIQRQQVRAQVWPDLLLSYSDSSFHMIWTNKGVGPALVKSVQVMVNGKPVNDWRSVFRSLSIGKMDYGQSTLNGNVISAGETLEWVKFKNQTDFHAFSDAAKRMKLNFRVCYCSTLGDCWISDSTRETWGSRIVVDQCPRLPESEQFHD